MADLTRYMMKQDILDRREIASDTDDEQMHSKKDRKSETRRAYRKREVYTRERGIRTKGQRPMNLWMSSKRSFTRLHA